MNENGVGKVLSQMPNFDLGNPEKNRNRHMKLVTRNTIPWKLRCESGTERDDPISRQDAFNMFMKDWSINIKGEEKNLKGYDWANIIIAITAGFIFIILGFQRFAHFDEKNTTGTCCCMT